MARASDPAAARTVAVAIVRRLREAGHAAYFAGGCVRDALLGLQPTDYDIATDAPPQRVRELFPRTAEVGAAFGVVLVHEYDQPPGQPRHRVSVEVATFRSDGPYTDARRPDTVHFSDAPSDASRRDFTINALFLDPLEPPAGESPRERAAGGRIIDHVRGVADLDAGVIRAVGNPDKRLAEDHLRALRAVRFAARFGFAIEPGTAAAITRHASELKGVSRERIGDELRRMLAHPARAEAVAMLQRLTLDAPVLLEPTRDAELVVLRGLPKVAGDPVVPLAAWALDRRGGATSGLGDQTIAKLVADWRRALCLSNFEHEVLGAVLRGHQSLSRAWSAAGVARRKRWGAAGWFGDALVLLGTSSPELAEEIRRTTSELARDGVGLDPNPLISGDDLVASGYNPGPAFRRVLDEVYDAQLEGRISSREQAMELARTLYV